MVKSHYIKSHYILRYVIRLIPIFFVATALFACSTTRSPKQAATMRIVNNSNHFLPQASQDEFEKMVFNMDIISKIMDQYAKWKGVRYRLGGITKRGIDCSGFVQMTFREQFKLDLPRSTLDQRKIGSKIQSNNLRPGDLVLFRVGSTGRHIGIYLGNDKFVHVSTSKGVIISNLNDNYWKPRYREARRVLLDSTQS